MSAKAGPMRHAVMCALGELDGRGDSAQVFCDASVVALIENEEGEPLNVGRETRTISASLRRTLNARDKGCRFPGCANTRYIDEGGVRVEILDDGAFGFVKVSGVAVDCVVPGFTQPIGDWKQIPASTGTLSRWKGDRMDLALAVDVLVQQPNKERNVPAGT